MQDLKKLVNNLLETSEKLKEYEKVSGFNQGTLSLKLILSKTNYYILYQGSIISEALLYASL